MISVLQWQKSLTTLTKFKIRTQKLENIQGNFQKNTKARKWIKMKLVRWGAYRFWVTKSKKKVLKKLLKTNLTKKNTQNENLLKKVLKH